MVLTEDANDPRQDFAADEKAASQAKRLTGEPGGGLPIAGIMMENLDSRGRAHPTCLCLERERRILAARTSQRLPLIKLEMHAPWEP